jgi:hypothetical protein
MSIDMDLAECERPSLKGQARRFLEKFACPSSCVSPLKVSQCLSVLLVDIYESSFQSMNKEPLVYFKGLSQD